MIFEEPKKELAESTRWALASMQPFGDSRVRGEGRSRQLRHFWLCTACCRTMTIVAEKEEGIKVVPLPVSASVARSAS